MQKLQLSHYILLIAIHVFTEVQIKLIRPFALNFCFFKVFLSKTAYHYNQIIKQTLIGVTQQISLLRGSTSSTKFLHRSLPVPLSCYCKACTPSNDLGPEVLEQYTQTLAEFS